jgi:hypothetical protein
MLPLKLLRNGYQVGWSDCQVLGKTAVPMKSHDFHCAAQVFSSPPTVCTATAGISRPDHKAPAGLFITDAHFMSQDARQDQISVPMCPHLGIGSTKGAMGYLKERLTWTHAGTHPPVNKTNSAWPFELQALHFNSIWI